MPRWYYGFIFSAYLALCAGWVYFLTLTHRDNCVTVSNRVIEQEVSGYPAWRQRTVTSTWTDSGKCVINRTTVIDEWNLCLAILLPVAPVTLLLVAIAVACGQVRLRCEWWLRWSFALTALAAIRVEWAALYGGLVFVRTLGQVGPTPQQEAMAEAVLWMVLAMMVGVAMEWLLRWRHRVQTARLVQWQALDCGFDATGGWDTASGSR